MQRVRYIFKKNKRDKKDEISKYRYGYGDWNMCFVKENEKDADKYEWMEPLPRVTGKICMSRASTVYMDM